MSEIFQTYINLLTEAFAQAPVELHVVTGIMAIAFLIQMCYYLGIFTSVFRYLRRCRKGKVSFMESRMPVSVIICAKNEDDNLKEFLPKVLEQDYPDFEVIVVNDGSTDDTEDVLKLLMSKYPNLRTTFVPQNAKFIDSKKFALTLGIKAAHNNVLIFTDADCEPKSNKWIQSMVRNFDKNTDVVLGYGSYKRQKSLLSAYISYDTLFIAIQYLNFALAGKPYMGVGRNMAYRKSLFTASRGFVSHLNIQSGDDDLFINDVATSHNTRVELSTESITASLPKETFKEWFMQKARHMSTSSYYKFSSKLILGAEILSRASIYICAILAFCSDSIYAWTAAAAMLLLRYIAQYSVVNSIAKMLDERRFWFGLMFFDITLPLLHLAAKVKDLLRGNQQYKWK